MKLPAWVDRVLYGRFGEQIRFLVAGAANTAFGYGLFALGLWTLSSLIASPVAIQWICWVLSVPFGAATFKYFTFRSPGPYLPQAAKAYLTYLPAQLVNSGLLWVFVYVFHWHPLIGQLFAIAVATVASYFGHKYITFRTVKEHSS